MTFVLENLVYPRICPSRDLTISVVSLDDRITFNACLNSSSLSGFFNLELKEGRGVREGSENKDFKSS